jgi:hypothetical protein
MQYEQRRLHRSVIEIRRSRTRRACPSINGTAIGRMVMNPGYA